MRILLIGATGSIGTSTLNCVRRYPERFELVGLAARASHERILKHAADFHVGAVCLHDPHAARQVRDRLGNSVHMYEGERGLLDMIGQTDFDVLVNALVGSAGLAPTVAALRRGKRVALANKESLVAGGELIGSILASGSGELMPIDSEHSAIMQCLQGHDRGVVESIILTASGGPFRALPLDRFDAITPEQALRHPTWSMGHKITIDSATLVNKGFEVIEAHHLFGVDYDKLRVCIHPQSIVHSMVEFHDGAVLAQLGLPDMELPIQYALQFPERLPIHGRRLDLASIGELTFEKTDDKRFPCLRLCIEAGRAGGAAPVVLNAVNEIAVKHFLEKRIRFTSIAAIIEDALAAQHHDAPRTLEDILDLDLRTRVAAEALAGRYHV